jgi:hypothetical protein
MKVIVFTSYPWDKRFPKLNACALATLLSEHQITIHGARIPKHASSVFGWFPRRGQGLLGIVAIAALVYAVARSVK